MKIVIIKSLTLPVPIPDKEKKLKLNFHFRTFVVPQKVKAFIKPFEALQRSVKIKI